VKDHKTQYANQTDEELMALICISDVEAFNELYSRYSGRLLYYFYRMLGYSKEKSQDFLQDIFLKIIQKPKLFKPDKPFKTWIFSIAHNMCKNEYRRLERTKENAENESKEEIESTQESAVDVKLFTAALFKELEQIDAAQKTAFLLRFREELSIKEISKILVCSEGTVKSRLFYTTKKLLKKLTKYNPNLTN